ncbi:MAG: hypothetical protein AB1646_25100 [Thermodesulfobacteriota bacterium]
MVQAKVFISCGQRSKKEKKTATNVKQVVEAQGFRAYTAVHDKSLKGLKENIFGQLQDSEYFLFIDFKREGLCGPGNGHRGSLFSHQELAIASYLEIEAIGFRETGVIETDGLMQAVQLNCVEFDTHKRLLKLVEETLKRKKEKKEWNPAWKAQLAMARPDPSQRGGDPDGDLFMFHIGVTNHHWRKTAHGCRAYLLSAKGTDGNEQIPTTGYELKWAGTKVPDATIIEGETRSFDAFEFRCKETPRIQWQLAYSDTPEVWPLIHKPGRYELVYAVTSQNFRLAKGTFELDLNDDIMTTTLTPKKPAA